MVQEELENDERPPEPPEHQTALPNPDEVKPLKLVVVRAATSRMKDVLARKRLAARVLSRPQAVCSDHECHAATTESVLLFPATGLHLEYIRCLCCTSLHAVGRRKQNEQFPRALLLSRLNSHLALTPLALHPHRLKEYNRSQASVALEFLFSWDYDLTPLTRIKSAKLAAELFHWVARRAEIEVPKETADRFILALQANYLNNSFHSFNHALHVAQIITLICKDYSFQRWFSFSDQFWMVVAALGHDIGHPGVGNASLIASRNLCAIMFNEKAVLESYHSFLLMELLRKSETDILAGFPMDVQQAARQRIVRAILATDPAFHFQLADELEALKTANPDMSGPATLLDEKTKDACLMRAGMMDSTRKTEEKRPFRRVAELTWRSG
ncbi:hypothetical protein Emag_002442 [Eimeria magna]